MSYEVFLLSKNYIPETTIINAIQKAAKDLGLNYEKSNYRNYIHQIWNPETAVTIHIYLNGIKEFEETKDPSFGFISGYGSRSVIAYNYGNEQEEHVLIPVMTILLKEIPELLLYMEEGLPGGVDYLVYDAAQLAAFTGTNFYAFIQTPRKDFSGMA